MENGKTPNKKKKKKEGKTGQANIDIALYSALAVDFCLPSRNVNLFGLQSAIEI